MFIALKSIFEKCIVHGTLEIITSREQHYVFGPQNKTERDVIIRLCDKKLEYQLVLHPQLVLGEAYMNGRLKVEKGSIYDFLALVLNGPGWASLPKWAKVIDRFWHLPKFFHHFISVARARKNIKHHYDIKDMVYDLFLDTDRQYSCAYFLMEQMNLEEAQLAKKHHLLAKLHLKPRQRVLDIGSGWGGLSLHLAKNGNVDVTGITLSQEQYKYAQTKAMKQGMTRDVHYALQDYRQVQGQFDRIISVGMFEHVGVRHYQTFFKKIYNLLIDDGVAVLHSIGRSDLPAPTNAFVDKYIFPGGYIPALSEVLPAIERSGLIVTDIEILRLHYAKTLSLWRKKFYASWDKIAQEMGDEFCRMWEYYLSISETAFRYQNFMVFQIQLAKKIDTLPITRDYMKTEEEKLYGQQKPEQQPLKKAGIKK